MEYRPGPHRAHDLAGKSEYEQAKMCVLRAEGKHGGERGARNQVVGA